MASERVERATRGTPTMSLNVRAEAQVVDGAQRADGRLEGCPKQQRQHAA